VRLLQDPEELQEAVERARGFERRGANEYQRRIGNYDRFLNKGDGPLSGPRFLGPSVVIDSFPKPESTTRSA
jgi:hypothetical protein